MNRIPEEKIDEIRAAADIVDVVSGYISLTRKGSSFQGLCPFHGEKTPSFNVNPARGGFHCFGCGVGGNAITFVQKIERLSFPEAARLLAARYHIAIDNENPARRSAAVSVQIPAVSARVEHEPKSPRIPAETWQATAIKLIEVSHQALLAYPDGLAYLAGRGLDLQAVKKYRLGWIAGENGKNCIYRPRSVWGLPPAVHADGPKKGQPKLQLWIPRGIVIPTFAGDRIDRIRIRRPNQDLRKKEDLKYIAIEGGGNTLISLNPAAKAQIVVESDFDALLIDHLAHDLVGAIPLTTCTVRPDTGIAAILADAAIILVAHDNDPIATDLATRKIKGPGPQNARWWIEHYRQAERWPVPPPSKDPGEAFTAGIDLLNWIIAALPVSLQPRKVGEAPQPTILSAVSVGSEPVTTTRSLTDRHGREYWITDSREEYVRLKVAGQVVFSEKEVAMVQKGVEISGEEGRHMAGLIMAAKHTFNGSFVGAFEDLREGLFNGSDWRRSWLYQNNIG